MLNTDLTVINDFYRFMGHSVVSTFIAMEFVAWFLHKYIMHGFLVMAPASSQKRP